MTILHVTNGDSAAEGLRQSGCVADNDAVLPWRDVLHDGPVPFDRDRQSFREVRSAFLTSRQWTSADKARSDLAHRDDTLDQHDGAIVLWFEPDLYDQLQLIQVLSRIVERGSRSVADISESVSMVPADTMLGSLAPSGFPPLFAARRHVGADAFERATRAWHAFTATTPQLFVDVMHRETAGTSGGSWPRTFANDAHECLPYLGHALHRQFSEYPDRDTGLSRSEEQICRSLVNGRVPLGQLFPLAHHGHETWPWLGDWSFAWYIERLRTAKHPLVHVTDAALFSESKSTPPTPEYWTREVALTPFGHAVINGAANAIIENGIDRWIGGTHLTTESHWCRDGSLLTQYSLPYT